MNQEYADLKALVVQARKDGKQNITLPVKYYHGWHDAIASLGCRLRICDHGTFLIV